jgi:adenylosuccinate synthase
MPNIAVVGTQWGDEGKGKIVDLLARHFQIIARFQGGHNAGHTVVHDGKTHFLHLIPSGMVRGNLLCVIGNGVVVDPAALLGEIERLKQSGIEVGDNLKISERSQVIFPYHGAKDSVSEDALGDKTKIGTTRRGIGPTYEGKAARTGIRMVDLLEDDVLRDLVGRNVDRNNRIMSCLYPGQAEILDANKVFEDYRRMARKLEKYICDTSLFLHERMNAGDSVLFEGAQGTQLDVDHGTFPFVTSSNTVAAGVGSGCGVGPTRIDGVIGVTKAYSTRVGGGPFPTEQENEDGALIRERGHEFGTTTGRPRRCGWFDVVVGRYGARVNGLDVLAVTMLDVLDEFEEIPVCTGYRYQGKLIRDFPASRKAQAEVQPVWERRPGWKSSTRGISSYRDLPRAARDYLDCIADQLGCPVGLVSTGPERNSTARVPGTVLDSWFGTL